MASRNGPPEGQQAAVGSGSTSGGPSLHIPPPTTGTLTSGAGGGGQQHDCSPEIVVACKCNKPWSTEDDKHIWQEMWDQIYEQNLVELISPQRPGVRGRLDKLTGLLSDRQEKLGTDDFGYRIHFGRLQRMHIRYLHTKLANLAVSAHFHNDEWNPGGKAEEIGRVLKEYIQAVRDHEYMAKYANASDDPFIATSQRIYDKTFLELAIAHDGKRRRDIKLPQDFLPSHVLNSEQGREQNVDSLLVQYATPTGPWERDNTDKLAASLTSTRTKAWKQAYWTRIGAAVIGGAFLIAPMWILALQRNLFVHLGVATACITAFGASMSRYLETVDNVFAATLAYAAVIMVFVGVVIQETAPSVA